MKQHRHHETRSNIVHFSDCSDLHARGKRSSGVYDVRPTPNSDWARVFCDMKEDAGWTVVQRRETGDVSFERNWADYKHGFGSLYGEFWMGHQVNGGTTNVQHNK